MKRAQAVKILSTLRNGGFKIKALIDNISIEQIKNIENELKHFLSIWTEITGLDNDFIQNLPFDSPKAVTQLTSLYKYFKTKIMPEIQGLKFLNDSFKEKKSEFNNIKKLNDFVNLIYYKIHNIDKFLEVCNSIKVTEEEAQNWKEELETLLTNSLNTLENIKQNLQQL